MLIARRLACTLIDKARRRGECVVLFVRNHPLLLLVAASLRRRVNGLVFQNSFPLEKQGNIARRQLHQVMLRVGGRCVDGLLAVSPLGLQRAQRLCPNDARGLVIPLLSDLPRASAAESAAWGGDKYSVRFVYVGSHSAQRRLVVVLEGVVAALDSGVNAAFVFIGGQSAEIAALRTESSFQFWESKGRIRFTGVLPRPRVPDFLAAADVGLSLVPESNTNKEMSPTKLAEYMGAGLAVVASRGVDLQETFMQDSRAGVLVTFETWAIADGIRKMCANQSFLNDCKLCAERFAKTHLNYMRYVPEFTASIIEN
jgi:glycosyltransferase involved in cell wall biosynthesis